MKFLFLQNNEFSGTVPSSWMNMNLLLELDLSNNYMTGLIPSWICNVQYATSIRFQENLFIGHIPSGWPTNSMSLTELLLNDNILSGSIPKELGKFLHYKKHYI